MIWYGVIYIHINKNTMTSGPYSWNPTSNAIILLAQFTIFSWLSLVNWFKKGKWGKQWNAMRLHGIKALYLVNLILLRHSRKVIPKTHFTTIDPILQSQWTIQNKRWTIISSVKSCVLHVITFHSIFFYFVSLSVRYVNML